VQRAAGGTAEGTEPLERPSNRGNNNTQVGHTTVRCGRVDWINLDQNFDQWRDSLNKVIIETSGYKRLAVLCGSVG
jgi:hypothetical protein